MATKRKNTASSERAAKRPKEKVDGETAKNPPTLLSIPAEMRNRMYEEVLLSDQEMDISNTAVKPPSLLATCRQIREEARKMWYLQNNFRVYIHDCDSDLYVKFDKAFADLRDDKGEDISVDVVFNLIFRPGIRDWPNLLEWCKTIQNTTCGRLSPASASYSNYVCVIATAHDVAWLHKSPKDWEQCRVVLESLRQAFGRIDKMWLQD